MSIEDILPEVFMELWEQHGIDGSSPVITDDGKVEITLKDYSYRDRFSFESEVFDANHPASIVARAFMFTKRIHARHSQMVN
jgi:hypothetical protein